MNYVGVDLHKKMSYVYVLDNRGKRIMSKNISSKPASVKKYLTQIPKPFKLAVEATYNWYYFIDIAEQYSDYVYLSDSYELKAFAKRHKKTDKIDARLIATVLYQGHLPAVYIADKKTREWRELLRCRIALVRSRSKLKSRLKMIFDKLGDSINGKIGSFTGLQNLMKVSKKYSESYRIVIKEHIENISYLNKKIQNMEKIIQRLGKKDIDIVNLEGICGIGYFGAALIKSEIINIARFKSFSRLCAYAGLAPRVSQSGNRCFHGPLNNNRRKNLQWLLIENVYHFCKGYSDKKKKFQAIKKRKGHNTAKVALARDLLKAVYIVLKEKRKYTLTKAT